MPRLPPHLATLPYQVHTNRELGLMLKGLKPLAVFSEREDRRLELFERYFRLFDRCVREGAFVKREYVRLPHDGGDAAHVTLYALRAEEWRIDAMIELWRT